MSTSAGAPGLPHVGDHFGRYLIEAEIGRGGMGVVYRAADIRAEVESRRLVALKVVSAELAASAEVLRRFDREAEVLAKLQSPHVIALYDRGNHDGRPFIATQFAAGGDLGTLIHQRGPMPARLALRVCAHVAEALAQAHRLGVVHHDVKPTNVLLRDADELDVHAYLCDFGIAQGADEDPASRLVAGTWSYLAPECGSGGPGTPASDVYALGCLLWAMLSGSPPFHGTDEEVAAAHRTAPIPQLPGADAFATRVNEVLRRTMAKLPGERHTDLDRLRAEVLDIAASTSPSDGSSPSQPVPDHVPDHVPGHVPGPEPVADDAPPPRRAGPVRRPLVAAALVALLVVAMFGASQIGGGEGDPASTKPDLTFATSTTASPSSAPPAPVSSAAITGDLDGDGFGDVSVDLDRTVRRGGSEISIIESFTWLSTGDRLEPGPTSTLDQGDDSYAQRVVGHFDDDDQIDVLVVRTFGAAPRLVVSGDLSGGATVESEVAHPGDRNLFAHVADLDGDGTDDLLFTSLVAFDRGGVDVLAARFDGVDFSDPALALRFEQNSDRLALGFGDLDGDGTDDIVALHNRERGGPDLESQLRVYLGRRGTFAAAGERRLVTSAAAPLRLADVDGDGTPEIVVVDDEPDGVRLGVVDRVGEVLKRPVWSKPIRLADEVVAAFGVSDVDGDGRDDIVVVGPSTSLTEAPLRVAQAEGDRFRITDWGTWTQRFDRRGDDRIYYVGQSLL